MLRAIPLTCKVAWASRGVGQERALFLIDMMDGYARREKIHEESGTMRGEVLYVNPAGDKGGGWFGSLHPYDSMDQRWGIRSTIVCAIGGITILVAILGSFC